MVVVVPPPPEIPDPPLAQDTGPVQGPPEKYDPDKHGHGKPKEEKEDKTDGPVSGVPGPEVRRG
jgi:hypothetical protein